MAVEATYRLRGTQICSGRVPRRARKGRSRTRNPLLRLFRITQYRNTPAIRPVGHPMLDVLLYQPEIPPNTGNIMRLCGIPGCGCI